MLSHMFVRDPQLLQKDATICTVVVFAVCLAVRMVEPYLHSGVSELDQPTSVALIHEAENFYRTSLQDKNAQVRYQHAVYANAYLDIARKLSRDTELERLTRFNIHELHSAISKQEKLSHKEMLKQCPRLKISSNSYPLGSTTRIPTVSVL